MTIRTVRPTISMSLLAFLSLWVVALSAQQQPLQTNLPLPTAGPDRLIPPYSLPSWVLQGDAQIKDSFIRLAEDRQGRRGSIWNVVPNTYPEWEVVFTFRIHGVSGQGADGLAFWYTERTGQQGSLYGSSEIFKGLGIVIDTYDNDGTGLHPYVMVLQNDGTQLTKQDHEHGAHKDRVGTELDGCTMHIRNLANPSSVKITYREHRLKVSVGIENLPYQQCIDLSNIVVPAGYYFGFSAATGDLADNHDLHSFTLHGLDSKGDPLPAKVEAFESGIQVAPASVGMVSTLHEELARVRTNIAEMNSRLDKMNQAIASALTRPAAAAPAPVVDPKASEREQQIAAQFDRMSQTVQDVKNSIEKTEQGLKAKLSQLETVVNVNANALNNNLKDKLTVAGDDDSNAGGESSILFYITCLTVLATCAALFFFQYSAYRRRKQKFF